MAQSPGLELIPASVERVLPFRDSAAVVLKAGDKNFMIFVGMFEAAAIMREIRSERTDRPLTHEVITYILTGFDIQVSKVIVSSIVNNIFCATLVLAQEGKTEVRLDIRASDSLVIALKAKSPIWVTRRVLEAVEDVTETLQKIDEQFATSEDEESETEDESESEGEGEGESESEEEGTEGKS